MPKTIFPVAMRLGDTPVLIPNTKVKTQTADGTMLETIWESRWLPDISKKSDLREQRAPQVIYIDNWFLPVIRGRERDPGF